jgi:hypothetical protein
MRPAEWISFTAQFSHLSIRQWPAGIALLHGNAPHDATVALLESVAQPRLACPTCPSHHLHRHGHAIYRAFARDAGISHQAVNLRAGIRVQGYDRGNTANCRNACGV